MYVLLRQDQWVTSALWVKSGPWFAIYSTVQYCNLANESRLYSSCFYCLTCQLYSVSPSLHFSVPPFPIPFPLLSIPSSSVSFPPPSISTSSICHQPSFSLLPSLLRHLGIVSRSSERQTGRNWISSRITFSLPLLWVLWSKPKCCCEWWGEVNQSIDVYCAIKVYSP